MKRILQLDGIRALAIALVIAHHAVKFGFGWAGVDLFFVLSGFLITGILRNSREDPSFWSTFYIKRAARILPALLLFFVLCTTFFTLNPRVLWLAYLLFCANIAEGLRGLGHSGPMGVLWSLAVEEHFYLVWPFAVRYLQRKSLIHLCMGIMILEPILRAAITPFSAGWGWTYSFTVFRLDGLAAGSLLALLVEEEATTKRVRQFAMPVLVFSIGVFAACKHFLPHFDRNANSVQFNALTYSLTTLVSASLIAYVLLRERAALSRALRVRALVFVGEISYGLYLFHVFLFDLSDKLFGEHHPHRWLLQLGCLAASILFSWASFHAYELPITRWGRRLAKEVSLSRAGDRGRRLAEADLA